MVPGSTGIVCLWQHIHRGSDKTANTNRNLLALPPVFYGRNEVRRCPGPRRAIPTKTKVRTSNRGDSCGQKEKEKGKRATTALPEIPQRDAHGFAVARLKSQISNHNAQRKQIRSQTEDTTICTRGYCVGSRSP